MTNGKLLQLIKKLPPIEQKKLLLYLKPGFLNSRQKVYELYKYILDNIHGNKQKLTNEEALAYLFPNEKQKAVKLRHLMTYLYKSIEKYLAIQHLERQEGEYHLLLAKAHREYETHKGQKTAIGNLTKVLKKKSQHSVKNYRLEYLCELEAYEESVHSRRTAARNLQAVNDKLDLAYMAEKLKDCCLALSHQSVTQVNYDTGLLPRVLAYIQESQLSERQPLIGMYYHYFMAETDTQNGQHFVKMRVLMEKHAHLLDRKEQRSLYLLAINYSIKKFNSGDNAQLPIVFELYKEALSRDILLENGKLSPYAFKNIGSIAIRLQAFEWTKEFIEKYQPQLPLSGQSDYGQYMRAKLFYAQQEYKQALQTLARVQFSDLFLNIDSKILLVKIFYEQAEWDALDAFITSTQRYLERQKMMGYHRQNYSNILYFTKRLVSINQNNKRMVQKLKRRIEESVPLLEKDWLLEQIDAL